MPDQTASPTDVHLTFSIGAEEYALPLARIAKTVSCERITAVPTAPPFIRGLVGIGGAAVPVVDLSLRFGSTRQESVSHPSVLALSVTIADRPTLMGLLVDRLGRVINVPSEQVQPPTALDALLPAEFLRGTVENDGAFVFLMDADRVLDADESASVADLATEEEQVAFEAQRESVPHLAVRLAGERCALRLSRLREALPYRPITRVPGVPAEVLGATNVRGSIVPVIDLARRYGLGVTRQHLDSRLILLDDETDHNASAVAFLVDAIDGLAHLVPGEIDHTPPFGTRFPTELVEGMAPVNGGFIPVLDGDRALSPHGAPGPRAEPA